MFDYEVQLISMPVRYPLLTAPGLIAIGLPGIASLLLALPSLPGVPRIAMLIIPAVLLAVLAFAGTEKVVP